jgi:uncharacterized protein involved in type VI secretion and phage assembly
MIPLKVVRLVKLVTPLGEALLFNRLEGSDGLSRNGEYRVTVLSRRPDIKGDELLGKSVSVKVTTPAAGCASSTAWRWASTRSASRAATTST